MLPAVQAKLHGSARDPDYLRTLIHVGAVDFCIDGLDEVAPGTRERIRNFAEKYPKTNIIIGTQDIDWWLPANPGPWNP